MATATKTASPAELRERLAAVVAELPAAEDRVKSARADLGAALINGQEASTAAAQAGMTAARLATERLEVGAEALREALTEAQAREDAAVRAVAVGEYRQALADADSVLQEWLAAAASLGAFAPELRRTFGRAESLHHKLYAGPILREDRTARPQLPYSLCGAVLNASLSGVHGAAFSASRGAEAVSKLRDYVARFAPKE